MDIAPYSDIFTQLSSRNWDMDPCDCSFDADKVKAYLSQLNEPHKSFIRDVIDNTRYVKYEEFKSKLFMAFDKFHQSIGKNKFFLLLSPSVSSMYWLTLLLWPKLCTMNLVKIIKSSTELDIKDDCAEKIDILIIDDAIYSGCNIMANVDTLTWDLSHSLNLTQRHVGNKFKFHIVTPYASVGGKHSIYEFSQVINVEIIHYIIENLKGCHSLVPIEKYYSTVFDTILYDKFGIENSNLPLIYFDHKVAGCCSTYSTIYMERRLPDGSSGDHLFKNEPSRSIVTKLQQYFKS